MVQQDLTWPLIADSWPACPGKHLASAVDRSPFPIPAPSQIPDFLTIYADGTSPARPGSHIESNLTLCAATRNYRPVTSSASRKWSISAVQYE
ncbi:hypothetical protein RSAG8_12782, partial [Rhizoctonia solani AG-8 WAC10335]